MSDDVRIQQQSPSAAPYMLGTGAVTGIAGGAYRRLKPTAPKYENFSQLVDEKVDTFTPSSDATDAEKALMEKAKAANEEGGVIKANYKKELNEYIEANKGGEIVKEGAEYDAWKAAADAQTAKQAEFDTAKAALDAKKQGLIDQEIAKINKANERAANYDPQKALNGYLERLGIRQERNKAAYDKINKYIEDAAVLGKDGEAVVSGLEKQVEAHKTLMENIANLEAFARGEKEIYQIGADGKKRAVNSFKVKVQGGREITIPKGRKGGFIEPSKLADIQASIKSAEKYNEEEFYKSMLQYNDGMLKDVLKGKNSEKAKSLQEFIEIIQNRRSNNERVGAELKSIEKEIAKFIEAKKGILPDEEVINIMKNKYATDSYYADYLKIAGEANPDAAKLKDAIQQMRTRISRLDQEALKKMETELADLELASKVQEYNKLKKAAGEMTGFIGDYRSGKRFNIRGRGLKASQEQRFAELQEELFGNKFTTEALTKAEKETNVAARLAKLKDSTGADGKVVQGEISKLKESIAKRTRNGSVALNRYFENLAGKGYTIEATKNGTETVYRLLKKDGTVFVPDLKNALTGSINNPGVAINREEIIKILGLDKVPADQVKAKAEANVEALLKDSVKEVETKKTALEAAKKTAEELKAKLKTTGEKTKEVLTEEFEKSKGKLEEKLKTVADKYKDDLKPLFEGGKAAWGKVAIWAAGAAAVGLALGALFAPKGDKNA